ncbi:MULTISPECIES: hypothetical protein [Lysinibacillus]|uniref:Uncharacterized protein n=1 Tax=Lysinibacillus irui TaxID=2998077 RepID=A0AAJ5RMB1_9BACI|nr:MULTISPECIES: hypothetical protein [Lysinibacillus]MEA0565244.1 hypothetical protein [Lysinibacillus irui]WDV08476.1 hypothetical protein OU989_08345 [Lysinibacillus irui]
MTREILLHAHSTMIAKKVASMFNSKLFFNWPSSYYVVYLSL